MNWRAGITTKKEYRTGYCKHDEIYCTHGKITTEEEAMKRVAKAWEKRNCNKKHHETYCYKSKI